MGLAVGAKEIKQVAAAIFRRADKVLIARRSPNERLAGKWEFPGGKVEGNETLRDCLQRELREEFSLICEIGAILGDSTHSYSHGEFQIVAIEAFGFDEKRLELTVHDQITWVTLDAIQKYDLLPADVELLKYLRLTRC